MIRSLRNISLITFAIFLMQCKPSPTGQHVKLIDFDSLINAYHEEHMLMYPLKATAAGDNRYNDTLPNSLTKAFRDQLNSHFTHYLSVLERVDTTSLSTNQRLSYDVLKWNCKEGLEASKFPSHLMPIDQFWTLQLEMGQHASGQAAQPFKSSQDYENWMQRVRDYMAWCDTAIVNMREGIKQGIVLPKALIVKVIPQMKALAVGPTNSHLFYQPALNIPDSIDIRFKSIIRLNYKAMVESEVIPMYQKLAAFLEEEYLPAGRESHGYSALPNGEAWYAQRMNHYTTIEMLPNDVFELGKKEVTRLEKEMKSVMKQVGFQADLKAFFDHVRNKKELMPFVDEQEVIANFNAIHEKMKPQISVLFSKIPKTPFEVRRTESFREASASAEYQTGSVDGTRPGIFYVPIPNVTKYNMYSDEDLFLHEAIPGHHFQESFQRESTELPIFRKLMWYSAYGEGWALYTESLGKELGLYTDPYQYFGMLSAEMHRAIRLVVDVGIHTKGWTREQAIQYSLDHEAESEASIIPEIERYMAGPGQALSYKIGQLKILELRHKAETTLGDKFNIKAFHNAILETGCIPLQVLENHINRWIEAQNINPTAG